MTGKVLIIVHQEHSTPGRIGQALEARGYELDIRRTCMGHDLPETLDDHDGAVIFGGPMSANDDVTLPFIRQELEWLQVPLREDKPFLGVCLGGQMLARVLGAPVCCSDHGWHEIGYYPIRATAAGRHLFADEQHFYQWHGEGFGLADTADLLAEGDYFPNQAFRYGRAYGIQFHPEVTREMMLRWSSKAAHRMVMPGAQSRDMHIAGNDRHDADIAAWLERFLDHWFDAARPAGAERVVSAAAAAKP